MDKKQKRIFLILFPLILILLILLILHSLTSRIERSRVRSDALEYIRAIKESEGDEGILSLFGYSLPTIEDELGIGKGDDKDETERRFVYRKALSFTVKITSQTSGAGIVISPDGVVLTASHVVPGKSAVIEFSDGRKFDGNVIARDEKSDVALLKVPGGDFAFAEFSSDEVFVGETVYSLGHPYSNYWSFESGMVSGLERSVRMENGGTIPSLIQLDMALYPGNSGGALLDGNARVVGLVNSNFSSSSIGFSLPVDKLRAMIPSLYSDGVFERAYIDAVLIPLDENIREYGKMKGESGLLVSEVLSGGNAEKSGLRGGDERVKYGQSVIFLGGDLVLSVDGVAVSSQADLERALFYHKKGDEVVLEAKRNGRIVTMNIELVGEGDVVWQR